MDPSRNELGRERPGWCGGARVSGRRLPTAAIGVALGVVGLAAAACGSSGSNNASSSTSSSTSAPANKTAFCAGNVTIDKASANTSSSAEFLAVLKANTAALDALESNAPAGKIGTEAKALVSFARNAVATNNASLLDSPPASLNSAGADIDTYCGVTGSGDPVPAYFAKGKGTALCSANSQIDAGTNTPDPAGLLAFLKTHQSLIDQFASHISELPASLQPGAQGLVSTARSAIASNNAQALQTPAVQTASMDVDLYCGVNH
jgi:hypothetical protein